MKQTDSANKERADKANKFALLVVNKLNDIEQEHDYIFKSLNDRCVALNHLGFTTAKGGKWTKTQMSRILKRATSLLLLVRTEL